MNWVEVYVVYNYYLLLVMIVWVEGVWVIDVEGKCYFDLLVVYFVVNFGYWYFVFVVVVIE